MRRGGGRTTSVFSSNDLISREELTEYYRKLESRESWASVEPSRQEVKLLDVEKMEQTILQLRMKDYLRMSKHNDSTDTAPTVNEYPDEITYNENPCDPNCMFDWAVDIQNAYQQDLDMYQAMLPTRLSIQTRPLCRSRGWPRSNVFFYQGRRGRRAVIQRYQHGRQRTFLPSAPLRVKYGGVAHEVL